MPQASGLGEAANLASTPGLSFGSDLRVLPLLSSFGAGIEQALQTSGSLGTWLMCRIHPFSQSHLHSSGKLKAVRYCHLGRLGTSRLVGSHQCFPFSDSQVLGEDVRKDKSGKRTPEWVLCKEGTRAGDVSPQV